MQRKLRRAWDEIRFRACRNPLEPSVSGPARREVGAVALVADLGRAGSDSTSREIAHAAGVKDEGQISKLLARLQSHGLLHNAGGPPQGANAWRLTPRGGAVLSASHSVTPGAGR